jgi:hypothetical protein
VAGELHGKGSGRARSASSGRYVTKRYAAKHKKSTVIEHDRSEKGNGSARRTGATLIRVGGGLFLFVVMTLAGAVIFFRGHRFVGVLTALLGLGLWYLTNRPPGLY